MERSTLGQTDRQPCGECIAGSGSVYRLNGEPREQDAPAGPCQQLPLIACFDRYGTHTALEKPHRCLLRVLPTGDSNTGKGFSLFGVQGDYVYATKQGIGK